MRRVKIVRYFVIAICLQLAIPSMMTAQEVNGNLYWQDQQVHDTIRLQILDSLIRKAHWRKQVDSSLFYITQQEYLALEGDLESWQTRALKNRGDLFYSIGNYLACIPAQEALIAAYDTTSAFRELSEAHRKLAYSLRKTNQDTKSLKHYQECLQFAEAAGEEGVLNLAAGLNSLGSYYLNRREYNLAKEKYLASLVLHQSINRTKGIYSNLNNLGLVYARTKEYEKAIEYYQVSLELKEKAGDKRRMANTYGNIGDIYLAWGKEDTARQYFLRAKALQEELGLRDELCRSLTQLGDLATLQGRPQEALDWCSRSCAIAEEDQLWQAALACHKCLYEAYKALGDMPAALTQYEAYTVVKDSVFNAESSREIAQMEAQLTYEKQQVIAEKEQLERTNQAKRDRLLLWIFVGSTFTLALFTWQAFRLSRLRKRQNVTLIDKNDQILNDQILIQRQADELKENSLVKDRFFANISHELRTPLTLVTSPLEKLLEQKDSKFSKPLRDTLSVVKSNANKLLKLVEELLELSQLEAGSVVLQQDNLLVLPFLQQFYDNYQLLAQEKNIDFEFTADIPPYLMIETDTSRLEKIIDNLLNNAFKFTPEKGKIHLSIQELNDGSKKLEISVADNGLGISDTDLPRLFDRYYQGTQNAKGGNGIGLALAQESAKILGGHIKAESSLGTGSVFTLAFPVREIKSQNVSLPDSNTPSPKNQKALRILIVEDNKELRDFLGDVLQVYNFTSVKNGKEAMKLFYQAHTRKQPFHLVLTDLMMPEMDGTELIEQIKQRPEFSRTKVIVLTAKQNLSDKLNLLRLGIDDYLTKPFSPKELQLRIHNVLKYPIGETEIDSLDSSEEQTSQTWLEGVEQHVKNLLTSKQDLSTGSLASALNLSNRQLLRKIQSATGMSTQLYLQECKLQLAQGYLETQQYTSVQEVAAACGFRTSSYFSNLYEQRFGKRPEELLNNRVN